MVFPRTGQQGVATKRYETCLSGVKVRETIKQRGMIKACKNEELRAKHRSESAINSYSYCNVTMFD